MRWSDLALPWQACLEEAWSAYCAGSQPIGAVVVNAAGEIVTRGRNHLNDHLAPPDQISHNQLAHAELNALLEMRTKPRDVHSYAIYTAVEPCPLCLGAIYMSGVRAIHYACRDDYAGSTNLIGTTPYLSHKPVNVFGPQAGVLEDAVFALHMEYHLHERSADDHVIVMQRRQIENGARLGEMLFSGGEVVRWRSASWGAEAVFDRLFTLLET